MKNILKVAVIGCGRIAGHHCRSIKSLTGAQLVAVCDLEINKANAYGAKFGVSSYRDYRKMMQEHLDVNLVVIATPSGMHFEHAMELISTFNSSVVVEKPTFMTPSQANLAYDLAESKGLNIYPVFQNRYNKAVSRVKKSLDSGELGKINIVSVRVRWNRPQSYYDLAPWRGTYAMDGGAASNQGIHHIDLIRYFGGEVEKLVSTMRTLGADIEVEDTAIAALRFNSGAVGNIEITTAARPNDFEASISIVCDKGMAQIGGVAVNELQIFTPNPSLCQENSEDFSDCVYGNGHSQMYKDILSHKVSRSRFPVQREDCIATLQLLHALYVSDEVGKWHVCASDSESSRLGRPNDMLADLYRTQTL